jgi:site-specific DNA-methyltransferase (adenine-specific)
MMINLIHGDCMEYMATLKDNEFDLAVVDPPYGIKQHKGISYGKYARNIHKEKDWDNDIPSQKYFEELMRVSKNQIIWGGNYFLDYLSNTRCMLVWDKHNGSNPMSDCELAWTSFSSSVRKFTYSHIQDHNAGIKRIHPTQKPIQLYQWIFDKYAQKGWRILDTHLGSGSSAIAAHDCGLEFVGVELDGDYFKAAKERLENHQRQLSFSW